MPGSRRSGGGRTAHGFPDWLWRKRNYIRRLLRSVGGFSGKHFLVPYKALRDEGTSYHYAPPSRFIDIDEKARKAIEKTILEHKMNYLEIITWSTDGFFRETKEKVAYRKEEGCSTVEMECSALAACARLRDVIWGMILYTADSLADAEAYDPRNWGGNAL